jgi:hypothetical protein
VERERDSEAMPRPTARTARTAIARRQVERTSVHVAFKISDAINEKLLEAGYSCGRLLEI